MRFAARTSQLVLLTSTGMDVDLHLRGWTWKSPAVERLGRDERAERLLNLATMRLQIVRVS
jgi:hypothetical protein